MAKRTPEEILAQRDAWMARKAARDAGEDVPLRPPLKPGEEPPESAAPEAEVESEQPAPEAEPEPESVVEEAAAEPEPAQPAAKEAPTPAMEPKKPKGKRTPEEIRAQREAFMAARAAKAAGAVAATEAKAEASAPAPTPAAAPAQPAPKPAPKPKPRPKPKAAPAPEEPAGPVTRREFLNYAWLASIALFTVETVGMSLWFAFPNFLAGQFGGIFPVGVASEVLPEVNSGPVPYTDGKFWLVNVDKEVNGEPRKGVLALFKVCTHLGCLYQWKEVTFRFECPCHGSKFQLTGDYISGPARRSLDRFIIRTYAPDDVKFQSPLAETDANGGPLIVNEGDVLVIDTGARIFGSSDITPA